MPATTNNNNGYIRSLDGLRALAVTGVVFFHSPLPLFQFPFGWTGVNLFFILSGFLITRILLASGTAPRAVYFGNFYTRRVLRIFPLYFFYLFASVVLLHLAGPHTKEELITEGVADWKNNRHFLLTYTYNFGGLVHFLTGDSYRNSRFFGHLWTLSVEEQFYLVFPLLVAFLPPRVLKKGLLGLLVIVPVARLITVIWLKQGISDKLWIGEMLYVSTPFQLDTLGLGAILALNTNAGGVGSFPGITPRRWLSRLSPRQWLTALVLLAVLIGAAHLLAARHYGLPIATGSLGFDNPVYQPLINTPYTLLDNRYFYSIPLLNGIFALSLVLAAKGQLFRTFLESRAMVFIGRISYGIYIYHLLASGLCEWAVRSAFNRDPSQLPAIWQVSLMLVYLSLLLLAAACSYRYLESPWLRLKERFAAASPAS